jgi:hypothetical protein
LRPRISPAEGAVILQACPNGSRLPGEHPALLVTPAQIVHACSDAVAAGAVDLHVHPKDDTGHDTVSAAVVDAVVRAVRHAVPGVPIGVTSGAWSRGGDRQAAIAEWAALPDHVSVNFHEEGAEDLAATLLNRGIGVDAGLFTTTNAADRLLAADLAGDCRYLLVEVTDPADAGLMVARRLLARLGELGAPMKTFSSIPTGHPRRTRLIWCDPRSHSAPSRDVRRVEARRDRLQSGPNRSVKNPSLGVRREGQSQRGWSAVVNRVHMPAGSGCRARWGHGAWCPVRRSRPRCGAGPGGRV